MMDKKTKEKLAAFPPHVAGDELKRAAIETYVDNKNSGNILAYLDKQEDWFVISKYDIHELINGIVSPAARMFLDPYQGSWINLTRDGRWGHAKISFYLTGSTDGYYLKNIPLYGPEDTKAELLKAISADSNNILPAISRWQDRQTDNHSRQDPTHLSYDDCVKQRQAEYEAEKNLETECFALIKPYPKAFKKFARKKTEENRYPKLLVYNRGKKQYVYCTHCKKFYENKGDRINLQYAENKACSHCHTVGSVISGKGAAKGLFYTNVGYLQKIPGNRGIILRQFYSYYSYELLNIKVGVDETYIMEEERRYFLFFEGQKVKAHDFAFKQDTNWYGNPYGDPYWHYISRRDWANNTHLYLANYKQVMKDTPFKYCAANVFTEKSEANNESCDIHDYLRYYSKKKYLEYLVKMGMTSLVSDIIRSPVSCTRIFNEKGKSARDILQLPGDLLKEAVSNNYSYSTIESEKKKRTLAAAAVGISDATAEDAKKYEKWKKLGLEIENFRLLFPKMHPDKLFRYLLKQQEKICFNTDLTLSFQETKQYYQDYLSMAAEVGENLEDEYYILPPDLHKAHERVNKIVEENRKIDRKKWDEEMNRMIASQLEKNKLVKQFVNMRMFGLFFHVPKTAQEFREEGSLMHNCVGGNHYITAQAEGESLILFIRKESEPDKPFCTFEWKDGKVNQVFMRRNTPISGTTKTFVDLVEKKIKKYQAKEAKKKGSKRHAARKETRMVAYA